MQPKSSTVLWPVAAAGHVYLCSEEEIILFTVCMLSDICCLKYVRCKSLHNGVGYSMPGMKH